ncbi:NAD-dependent epimerase/dehydratase family protein [Patescibacteria group bacterium]|nr:NAD-dependent epimerase/dehydratase family protein [Patescibacteria group bacterium]
MKILIFGAHGFLGRNLVEQLGGKYQLITPSRQDIDLMQTAHISNEIDVVINCVNAEDNLTVFYNITRCYSGKLIQIGSGAEYDKSKPIKNVKEEDFGRRPKDKYGLDKYFISGFIEWMDNIICLRPFGLFGKYEDYERRFISKAVLDNMKGEPITIYQNVKFNYVWVNDFIKIIDYFITHEPKHKIYNVGGHQLKLTEIAKKIGKYKVLKEGMANEYTCDDSRVRKETGIKYTPFDDSLESLRRFL